MASNDDDIRNRILRGGVRGNSRIDEDESNDSIISIWEKQEKMRDEDKKLEAELKRAQKQTKELRKQLIKNKLGDTQELLGSIVSRDGKVVAIVQKVAKKAPNYIPERIKKDKKIQYTIIASLIVLGGFMTINRLSNNSSENNEVATLGENTNNVIGLPKETPRDFSMLFPSNKDASDYEVVRISPDGAAASYTYVDGFEGNKVRFNVTQQVVPSNFNLKEIATDFQATNVIQVDETTIYHGYSEQGGVQSLIFIKNDILVSIRCPQKMDDDLWAQYVLNLQ